MHYKACNHTSTGTDLTSSHGCLFNNFPPDIKPQRPKSISLNPQITVALAPGWRIEERINPSMLNPPEIVFWNYGTFDNNFVIKNDLVKYLKKSYW